MCNKDTIGARIKYVRKLRRISQAKFAKEVKISQSFLSELETDKAFPGKKALLSFQKYLRVNTNWILTGNGDIFLNEKDFNSEIPDLDLYPEIEELINDHIEIKRLVNKITDKIRNLNDKLSYSECTCKLNSNS